MEWINFGIRKLKDDFLPNPYRFAKSCVATISDHGLPSVAEAFKHARVEAGKRAESRKWVHPVIYKSAVEFGFFELRILMDNDRDFKECRSRFEKIYLEICYQFIDGRQIVVPETHQVTVQPKSKASKKFAKPYRANLASLFD